MGYHSKSIDHHSKIPIVLIFLRKVFRDSRLVVFYKGFFKRFANFIEKHWNCRLLLTFLKYNIKVIKHKIVDTRITSKKNGAKQNKILEIKSLCRIRFSAKYFLLKNHKRVILHIS